MARDGGFRHLIVFWDGISYLSDLNSLEHRLANDWFAVLQRERPAVNIHVLGSGDVNSTVAHNKPCCISFSYVSQNQDIMTLAVHIAGQFSPVLFNSQLFLPLRDILMDPCYVKNCATRDSAHQVHTLFQHYFKINIARFRAFTESNWMWSQVLRSEESSPVLQGYLRRLIADFDYGRIDQKSVLEAVTSASYSLSSAGSLVSEDTRQLRMIVGMMHRTMIGLANREFDRRRRVAIGGNWRGGG